MLPSNKENHKCLSQRAVWKVIKGLQLYAWKTARMLLMNSMTLYPWHTSRLLVHIRKWVHVSWTEVNFPKCLSDGMPPFFSRNRSSAKSYRESDTGIPQSFVHISVSSCPTHVAAFVHAASKVCGLLRGKEASTTNYHAQRQLCTYERQLMLLWDSCATFGAPFAHSEERVKTF